ncbi:MAG: tRNA uridine-5-carboxymethylaminomethyl(34) synthesis GTPase MnmE [bacterium]
MDTIVAIATASGPGGIAIIRLSGVRALSIVSVFLSRPVLKTRYLYYCSFYDPKQDLLVDHGCVVYFEGPASYTGEDVVELHVHASSFVLKTLMAALIREGARLAQQGEFTKRAYLNGKLTLEQAEGVAELISSDHAFSHQVAMGHVQGKMMGYLQAIREPFVAFLAQLEGSIDFPDEVPVVSRDTFKSLVLEKQMWLKGVLDQQDFGRVLSRGLRCVIMGRPNVGKSTLFNTLLGEERVLVSAEAGTTRDYIEEKIQLKGIPFCLIDTAGIHETQDVVEKEGIAKIKELIRSVDLCLFVVDLQQGSIAADLQYFRRYAKDKDFIVVVNKQDLLTDDYVVPDMAAAFKVVSVSAVSDRRLSILQEALLDFVASKQPGEDLSLLCTLRQEAALRRLSDLMVTLLVQLNEAVYDDLLVPLLKDIVLCCDDMCGETLSEEVLDTVFSRFCVGK